MCASFTLWMNFSTVDRKITRIALDNGFPTTAAFNKAFKEVYHVNTVRVSSAGERKRPAGTGEGRGSAWREAF